MKKNKRKNKFVWNEKTDFCLLVLTKSGESHRHYFESYDDLDYHSTFYEYSPNIAKARGMVLDYDGKWKCVFRIG